MKQCPVGGCPTMIQRPPEGTVEDGCRQHLATVHGLHHGPAQDRMLKHW